MLRIMRPMLRTSQDQRRRLSSASGQDANYSQTDLNRRRHSSFVGEGSSNKLKSDHRRLSHEQPLLESPGQIVSTRRRSSDSIRKLKREDSVLDASSSRIGVVIVVMALFIIVILLLSIYQLLG